MIAILYIIGTVLVCYAGGYAFRTAGIAVTKNDPYFRDMQLGVAAGYVLGLLAVAGGLYLYFTASNPFFGWAVHGFILFSVMAYYFRLLGRQFGSESSRKLFRQMPLTAAFGILIIILYAFLAVFAGQTSLSTLFFVGFLFVPITLYANNSMAPDAARQTILISLIILGVFILMFILGPIAPHPQEQIFEFANVVPGGDPNTGGNPDFPLGTDQIGRDILSRLIYGAQNTVGIAFVTTCLAFLIGITFGFLAAIKGGMADQIISRVVDALMAIPSLIFALLLMTIATAWATSDGWFILVLVKFFGSPQILITVAMILIIAVLDSTRVFRLSRAVGINIVVMDYIEAAKLRGETLGYLIFKEILPNALAPLLAEFGLRFCFVFLTIASLSFLGVGIQPPLADWGTMVKDLGQLINFAVYIPLAATAPLLAAGAIALLTVGVNFVVDWMLQRSSGLKE